MKTTKHLSDAVIYHTGGKKKKKKGHSTNQLSSDLPPDSPNSAQQKGDRFRHQLSTPWKWINMF